MELLNWALAVLVLGGVFFGPHIVKSFKVMRTRQKWDPSMNFTGYLEGVEWVPIHEPSTFREVVFLFSKWVRMMGNESPDFTFGNVDFNDSVSVSSTLADLNAVEWQKHDGRLQSPDEKFWTYVEPADEGHMLYFVRKHPEKEHEAIFLMRICYLDQSED